MGCYYLSDIKKSELNKITQVFIETLHLQLKNDGIEITYETLKGIIGEIKQYGSFENLPFRKINSGLNSSPNKMLKWKYPKEAMKETLEEINLKK